MNNGDEDDSIKAARDAFWKAYAHTFYMKGDARTTAQGSVFETLKSVVQAVNKNSSDFVYSLLPSARVDEQISCYQHDLFKSQDGYNLMLSILEYYNRLDEHWIAPEDEHARKVLGLPFDFQQGKHFYIGLITNDFILWCVVGNKDASLKAFLKCYTGELASRLDKSPTSLWFEYKNTPLFSSDAGKKKMGQFENGDLIYVSLKANSSPTKKEVFLTTFNIDNGNEDCSIKAAREAYWKTYVQTVTIKQPPEELYATPESLVQTVNKGSSDFVYSLLPSARVDEKINFRELELYKSHDCIDLIDSFFTYLKSLSQDSIILKDEHVRKALGLPFFNSEEGALIIGLHTKSLIFWCPVANKDASLNTFLKCYTGELASRLIHLQLPSGLSIRTLHYFRVMLARKRWENSRMGI